VESTVNGLSIIVESTGCHANPRHAVSCAGGSGRTNRISGRYRFRDPQLSTATVPMLASHFGMYIHVMVALTDARQFGSAFGTAWGVVSNSRPAGVHALKNYHVGRATVRAFPLEAR